MTDMNELKQEPRSGLSDLTAGLAADADDFEVNRFDDEYIEKQLRSVAAMRGDGNAEDSLAYQAAECIARLRIEVSGGVVKLEDVPDTELPGMWERADFM